MPEQSAPQPPWRTRLAWFVGLWACGVAAVAIVSFALRWLLR